MARDYLVPAFSGAAFCIGVSLHLFVFRFGEWDLSTTVLLKYLGLLEICMTLIFTRWPLPGVSSDGFMFSSLTLLSVLAGIYASLLIYRAAFHRLNRFPGPFMARLSNLYITSLSIKKFHLYEELQQLHKVYGDIVRIGPSEISIIDPRAFSAIHMNSSPCIKGPWYNIMHPVKSLHMMRDKKEHSKRRKTWDKAFSSKALRDYEPRVNEYTNQLLSIINASEGSALDASTWFNFYSFDVMGDLAFGKAFDMMKDGVVHYFMKSVHTNMLLVSAFSHLVWIFPLFKEIPGLNHEHVKFQKWLSAQVVRRQANKPDLPDVFSWILDDYDKIETPTAQDTVNLHGDAHLIVVAGSDTTAASLTCLFFELARNPIQCQILQREIDDCYVQDAAPQNISLSKLKYLQACIDESLRLHPPVPSGVQRMTPPDGLQIGEIFIPGNTVLTIPTYTLNRDARLFQNPDEFKPERWTSQPDLNTDGSTFAPFSIGRYSCVGKQLGLMELRYVTSRILRDFDVKLASNDIEVQFLTGLKDGFTLAAPGLKVVFTKRKRAKG